MNEDGTWDITLYWDGIEMGTIKKDKTGDGYQAELIEVNDENAYIGVSITGLGGYILYGGAHSVYRLNLESKEITEIWYVETSTNYVTDISPEENSLVGFYINEVGETILSIVDIASLTDSDMDRVEINYIVSDEFDEAGDGQFSPDGEKLAYAVSIKGDWEEVTALFVIDLDTGKVKEMTREKGTGQVVWLDEDTVVLD